MNGRPCLGPQRPGTRILAHVAEVATRLSGFLTRVLWRPKGPSVLLEPDTGVLVCRLPHQPGAPNSPKWAIFVYFGPHSRYYYPYLERRARERRPLAIAVSLVREVLRRVLEDEPHVSLSERQFGDVGP